MLEEVYQELLRAGRRGAARAFDQLAGEEVPEPDK
jgi:hypothetical protein